MLNLQKNGTVIGILSTVVVAVISFSFSFGVLNNRMNENSRAIIDIQNSKLLETRTTVEQHEKRLANLELKQDAMQRDIGDIRADVKVIRQILQKP